MSDNDNNRSIPIREELLGIHSMNPFIANSSSPRGSMMSQHLSQIVTPTAGDTQIIQSGLEFQWAENTFSKKITNDSRIISVLKRYNGVSVNSVTETTELLVIYEDLVTNEIDCLSVPQYHKLHQYFGFKYNWNEEALNECSYGSILNAGTVLADSPAVTKDGEYNFGLLSNLCFLSLPETSGDGVVISESMSKRLGYSMFETRVVEFGEDTFPLNLYGDKDNYRPFPEIGEYIGEDNVVMALRDRDELLAPVLTSIHDVMDFDPTFDKPVFVKGRGKIIDIKAYSNPKTKKFPLTGTADTTNKYVNGLKHYYQDLIEVYERLTKEQYAKFRSVDLKVSERLHRLLVDAYAVCTDTVNIKFKYKNELLDLYRIEFVIEHKVLEMTKGSKVSNLHGGKGVIVDIRPDEDMPVDAQGRRADVIMDPTSIVGRMNTGTLYEQYFNSMSRHTRDRVRQELLGTHMDIDDIDDTNINRIFDIVLGLTAVIGTEQHTGYCAATTEQRRVVLREIQNKELYLYYKVSSARRPYEIIREIIGTEYEPKLEQIVFNTDGIPTLSKGSVMVAPQYIILLAKVPDDSLLSSASAKRNHYGLPIGVGAKDRERLPYRQSPVKVLSETETRLYASYVGQEGLGELKDRGNSLTTHGHIYRELLTAPTPTNVDNLVDRNVIPFGEDKSIELVDNILNASGMELKYVPGR